MSQPDTSPASIVATVKLILGSIGVLVFFGFLTLILSGFAGRESLAERTFMGEFDAETTEQRWANLEEVRAAQDEAFDPAKVDEALAAIAAAPAAPSKTDAVVPGSPTFLKQSEAPAEEIEAEEDAPAEGEADKPEGSETPDDGEQADEEAPAEGEAPQA